MLGILLIYFIGKRFYDLSEEYNQNKWLYAILGVVLYYVSSFVFGMLIALLDIYVFDWGIDWDNNFGANFNGLPVAILALWGFYMFLESKWKKSVIVVKNEIEDIGKNIEDI
ncbi:hypothetical protein AAFN75_12555 [Algibacter sp. AS12]|uniref:hypothetical protein n=1 Tax=Algibacter sp. AS12 TaxID=3135773 RepID=UPI00398A8397